MSDVSTNLKIASRYLGKLWSEGCYACVDELVAPTCEVLDPMIRDGSGPAALCAHIREMRVAFPDLRVRVDRVLFEAGEQIALAWTARGTHRGDLFTLAATGGAIAVTGILLLRFRDSKLTAITCYWEPVDMLRQLDLLARASCSSRASEQSALDASW